MAFTGYRHFTSLVAAERQRRVPYTAAACAARGKKFVPDMVPEA